MKILLDTHILLWFANGDPALDSGQRKLIESPENECFVSIVSMWEIAIKHSQGKLELATGFAAFWQQTLENDIRLLDISFSHLMTLLTLPYTHKDPFDRLIIAQAIADELYVLTKDAYFEAYGVRLA